MPTPLETLKEALIYIFEQGITYTDGEAAKEFVADEMSAAIDEFVSETALTPANFKAIIRENFVYQAGQALEWTASSASGGNSAPNASRFLAAANLNGITNKQRAGLHQLSVNNSGTNAFASLVNSSAINAPNWQFLSVGNFYVDFDWAQTVTPIINFANDPVLACVGFLVFTATTAVNPTLGVYFRMPRNGEVQKIKYVVRTGSAETFVGDMDTPVTTNTTGYHRTGMYWDGANDTMYFYSDDGEGNSSVKTITSFLATYPSFAGTLLHLCAFTARNGTGAIMAQTIIQVDSAGVYIPENYDSNI